MSAIPRPSRNAVPGEIVNFLEGGDPTSLPFPALVHQVHPGGACTLMLLRPGYPGAVTKHGVKHIHDQYWDSMPITAKQNNGCFDFHPVYKGLFDRHLAAVAGNKAKAEQLEREKTDMSEEDFNACLALERHGDNIKKISEETGISRTRLMKLPKFMEELRALKGQKWMEKNDLTLSETAPEPAPAPAAAAE